MNIIKRIILLGILLMPYALDAGLLEFVAVMQKYKNSLQDGKRIEKLRVTKDNRNLYVTSEKDTCPDEENPEKYSLNGVEYLGIDKNQNFSSKHMYLSPNGNVYLFIDADKKMQIQGLYDGTIKLCVKDNQNKITVIEPEVYYWNTHRGRITSLCSYKDEFGRFNIMSGDEFGQVNHWRIAKN